jgi:hypothetical protein
MKKYIVLGFLYILNLGIYAQTNEIKMPDFVPPTPQAAQFIRYGEIPVSHTTGVPQIEVPIYILSTGWIDIPISISYHASGFRVRDIPSPVGLGWVLNAGGLISRSIEVKADFENTDVMAVKSVADVEALKNGSLKPFGSVDFSEHGSVDTWNNFIFGVQNTASLDTRTDRYVYNFLGKSGVARYDVDANKLLPVPYAPLIINRVSKDCYVITDTKGIKYEFTYPEYTKASNNWQNAPTGWYITKITYPGMESDPVVFTYKRVTQYSETVYSKTIEFQTQNVYGGGSINRITSYPYTVSYYDSPIIDKITWRNINIQFNYTSDRQDKRKERLNSVIVKNGNTTIRQATLGNNCYFGTKKENYRLKLAEITLTGSNANEYKETYSFTYNNITPPDYLDSYCQEDFWGYYNGTKSGSFLHSYVASWWNSHLPSPALTGASMVLTSSDYTDRNPNEDYTKTCQLEEIVYPTKGKTRFEYEINRGNPYQFPNGNIDKVGGLRLKKRINLSPDGTVLDCKEYEYAGSPTMLITTEMFHGEVINIGPRNYDSEGNAIPEIFPSSIFNSSPMYPLTGWSNSPVFYYKVTEYNGEKTLRGDDWAYSGKTEYNYMQNYSQSIESACYNDGTNWSPIYGFSIYSNCDKGYIQEYPTSIIIYDKDGIILKKKENQYVPFSIPNIHYGIHIELTIRLLSDFNGFLAPCGNGVPYDPLVPVDREKCHQYLFEEYFLKNIVSRNSYALQDMYLLGSTTETDYVNGQPATGETTSYSYDVKDYKPRLTTPSSVTFKDSNGEIRVKKTVFPYSDIYKNTVPYNTMVGKNMLDYPLEIKNEKGSNGQFLSQSLTSYKQVANMILPGVLSQRYTAGAAAEPRIIYQNYDLYGNPVYITKDNIENMVYLWSYNGQYPIAQIENATFAEVETAVKSVFSVAGIDALSALATPNETKLQGGSLQKALPNALVTTRSYRPLIGMASVTGSNGMLMKYYHDTFGRLFLVRDDNQNIIKRYRYNYKGASDNGMGGYQGVSAAINLGSASYYTVGSTYAVSLSNISGGSGNYSYSWYLKNTSGTVLSSMPNTASTSYSFTCSQAGDMYIQCIITDNMTGQAYAVSHTSPITVISAVTGYLTMDGSYFGISQNITVTGSNVNVSVSFATNTQMKPGYTYLLGTISENCRPSTSRSVTVQTSEYKVIYSISTNGVINCSVVSYSIPPGFFPNGDGRTLEFSYTK